jgi:mannose-6-phosphate isomerase-like protein (cupin superfamily)
VRGRQRLVVPLVLAACAPAPLPSAQVQPPRPVLVASVATLVSRAPKVISPTPTVPSFSFTRVALQAGAIAIPKEAGVQAQVLELGVGQARTLSSSPSRNAALVLLEGSVTLISMLNAVELHRAYQGARIFSGDVKVHSNSHSKLLFVDLEASGPPNFSTKAQGLKVQGTRFVEHFDFAQRPAYSWSNGAYHGIMAWDEESKYALNAVFFSKDASVAPHMHAAEWECLFILEGDGELFIEEEQEHLEAGAVRCIPAGKRHGWTPSGTAPLRAIQIYAPAGPEQRWKTLQ